ncbi:hypothetical protein AB5I41_00380 [Sphingomonas sp. MMS24-JH45]
MEGTCGGDMACATCHVVLAPADAGRVAAAQEEEEDMLDLVPRAVATSRLACQIRLDEALANLSVLLADGFRRGAARLGHHPPIESWRGVKRMKLMALTIAVWSR